MLLWPSLLRLRISSAGSLLRVCSGPLLKLGATWSPRPFPSQPPVDAHDLAVCFVELVLVCRAPSPRAAPSAWAFRLCSPALLVHWLVHCRLFLPPPTAPLPTQHAALPFDTSRPRHPWPCLDQREDAARGASGRKAEVRVRRGSCTRAAAGASRVGGSPHTAATARAPPGRRVWHCPVDLELQGGGRQARAALSGRAMPAARPAACRPARDCIPLIAQAHVLLGLKRRCAGARGAGGVRGASRAPRGALLRRKRTISVQAHFGLAYCRCRSLRSGDER